jgi:CheY-like chemotaxis protein
MKVLIAEDDPLVRRYLSTMARSFGHECLEADNGVDALEVFEKENPDLVLSDYQMPLMDGFKLLREIRELSQSVAVIIITGEGSGEVAARALQLGANNYLYKPVADKQLRHLFAQYAAIVSKRSVNCQLERMVESRSLQMSIDNCLELTTNVAQFLVNEVVWLLSEKACMDVTLGLDELICNAIEHGNLGITQEEKELSYREPDGLAKLHASRLADPVLAARRVRIDFSCEKGRYCEWTIADEGAGFDWRNVPSPLDDNGDKPCGRGIFLGRILFDHFEHRGKGNVVSVRKNVAGAAREIR